MAFTERALGIQVGRISESTVSVLPTLCAQGDSGGPFMCKNVLQGIVCCGQKNGKPPRVFTKVSSFLPWINETMKSYEKPLTVGTSPPSLELIQNVTSN